MISGHPISTDFLRLTDCQRDPQDRGVTSKHATNFASIVDEAMTDCLTLFHDTAPSVNKNR